MEKVYQKDSGKTMRQALGVLGMVLPVAILFFGKVFGGDANQPHYFASISATYYSTTFVLMAGLIFATGLFLICYRGYDVKDWWLSLIAGIGALVLTIFPCEVNGAPVWNLFMLPMKITNILHLIGALVFFGALFWIVEFQFTKTAPGVQLTGRKRIRNIFYKVSGWVMLGGLVVGFGGSFLLGKYWGYWVFAGEWVGLWAFGAPWLVKGEMVLADIK